MSETIFNLGNLLAMAGWLTLLAGLAIRPFRPRSIGLVRLVAALVFGAAYIGLLVAGREAFGEGGFSSIAAVRALFANDYALTAGWLHYLAFDLFVGAWIVEDSGRRGIPGWLIVPCLGLTFMFGPAGLLLYAVLSLFAPEKKAA
ncbi:putative membrane protein [Asticcacaulis biprosthecium C19]|uniref:Putative membrane protein n=1 Tax=Asticcacaulis biprosthecium C19 TaxID=715226 RepID=F4QSK5_9CAUL|nr:ABA4-like family protein [Asticcacaulis biprosthecium]EGF89725.1 putative membrane protein [Asticcacaulis biprosthecium C19]